MHSSRVGDVADIIVEQELYRACRVLFGPELDISRDFLQYLQTSGVKSAYRRKALETHPDLASSRSSISYQTFTSTREAYEKLIDYLAAREEKGYGLVNSSGRSIHVERPDAPGKNSPRKKRPVPGGRVRQNSLKPGLAGTPARVDIDDLYQGPLPLRSLLFGHYLFYSGRVNWRTIAHALLWQRVNRPRLGEIGRRFGWLNEDDVMRVIHGSELQQPFGASAISMGLLSESQLNLLVFQQKTLQKRFGQYFIINELFSPRILAGFLVEHIRHNREFAGSH